MFPAARKDVLPALQQSNVIYEFKCHCDCRYVGRTSKRLQDRIKEHIPPSVKSYISNSQLNNPLVLEHNQAMGQKSSIGKHLLENHTCAANYHEDMFSILAKGRNLFHLSVLESTIITMSKPSLCQQKEFVYHLKIAH